MKFEVGDVFFSRGTAWWSRAIHFFTRSRVDHAGVCIVGGGWDTAQWVSATAEGVTPHGTWNMPWAIYRPLNLTLKEKTAVAREAIRMVGTPYSFAGLLAYALDITLGVPAVWRERPPFLYRRILDSDDFTFCSQGLVTWLSFARGALKDFSVRDPRRASPEDLYSFCRERTDIYREVHSLTVPEVKG